MLLKCEHRTNDKLFVAVSSHTIGHVIEVFERCKVCGEGRRRILTLDNVPFRGNPTFNRLGLFTK